MGLFKRKDTVEKEREIELAKQEESKASCDQLRKEILELYKDKFSIHNALQGFGTPEIIMYKREDENFKWFGNLELRGMYIFCQIDNYTFRAKIHIHNYYSKLDNPYDKEFKDFIEFEEFLLKYKIDVGLKIVDKEDFRRYIYIDPYSTHRKGACRVLD